MARSTSGDATSVSRGKASPLAASATQVRTRKPRDVSGENSTRQVAGAVALARVKTSRMKTEQELAAAASRVRRLMEEAEKADKAIRDAKRKTAALLAARERAEEVGATAEVQQPETPKDRLQSARRKLSSSPGRPPSARSKRAPAAPSTTLASSEQKRSPSPMAHQQRKPGKPLGTRQKKEAKATPSSDVRVQVIAGLGWGSTSASEATNNNVPRYPSQQLNETDNFVSAESEALAAADIASANGLEALRLIQERALLRSSCGSRASIDGQSALDKLYARYTDSDTPVKTPGFSFKLDLSSPLTDPTAVESDIGHLSHRSDASELHYAPNVPE